MGHCSGCWWWITTSCSWCFEWGMFIANYQCNCFIELMLCLSLSLTFLNQEISRIWWTFTIIADCISSQIPCFSSWKRKMGNIVRIANDEYHRISCWQPSNFYERWAYACCIPFVHNQITLFLFNFGNMYEVNAINSCNSWFFVWMENNTCFVFQF